MGLIRDIIAIKAEEARKNKALRILSKQQWSIEFLTDLLRRASKLDGQGLELTITSADGRKITVKTAKNSPTIDDTSILDHLDDDVAIRRFIAQLQRGSK